jgi:hypothetical protein
MTQTDDVLRELRERGPIGLTAREAQTLVGTDRLAARIADLKARGYHIERRMVVVPTRRSPRPVARYYLVENEQQPLGLAS